METLQETRDKTSLQPAQVAEQLGTDLAKESVIMPQIPKDDSFKENVCVKRKEKGRKFSSVRVGMLENLEGKFLTIISGFGINHIAHTQAVLQNTFKNKSLKIVAITDGATSIKNDLAAMFGENYTHILDWYHLEKKVYQTMSMVSEKGKKDEDCKKILHHLWHGKVEQAISYLHTIVAKQEDKKAMLITYFTKNKLIIIDYDGRKKQNKTIGSGRCEKQNDVLVAKRQKNNTMAWSENGSLALALVTQYFNENQG